MKKLIMLITVMAITMFSGCTTDATRASQNLSIAAENFELNRRIVFYNGITGEYMLVIEGRSSIEVEPSKNRLAVTVKTGPGMFKKHYLGLSDNISYFSEQLEASPADVYHYRVIFKPANIIPTIEVK